MQAFNSSSDFRSHHWEVRVCLANGYMVRCDVLCFVSVSHVPVHVFLRRVVYSALDFEVPSLFSYTSVMLVETLVSLLDGLSRSNEGMTWRLIHQGLSRWAFVQTAGEPVPGGCNSADGISSHECTHLNLLQNRGSCRRHKVRSSFVSSRFATSTIRLCGCSRSDRPSRSFTDSSYPEVPPRPPRNSRV